MATVQIDPLIEEIKEGSNIASNENQVRPRGNSTQDVQQPIELIRIDDPRFGPKHHPIIA